MVNGRQISAARVWLGISQSELAKASKVATRTVVRIEGVQTNPHSTTNLHAVIESFNVLPPD